MALRLLITMIRKMEFPDLPRVAEIHVAAWHSAYRGILPDQRLAELNVEEQTELWETTLFRRESRTNLVLLDDGRIHGWSAIGPARDDDEDPRHTGEIYGVHVHPDSHRRGFGTALLTYAHGVFRDRGYPESVLWVVEENRNARQFYEHRKYRQDPGTRKITDWMSVPEVRYRRSL